MVCNMLSSKSPIRKFGAGIHMIFKVARWVKQVSMRKHGVNAAIVIQQWSAMNPSTLSLTVMKHGRIPLELDSFKCGILGPIKKRTS